MLTGNLSYLNESEIYKCKKPIMEYLVYSCHLPVLAFDENYYYFLKTDALSGYLKKMSLYLKAVSLLSK